MKSGMMMSQSVKPPQACLNCSWTASGIVQALFTAQKTGPMTVRRSMSSPRRMSSDRRRLLFSMPIFYHNAVGLGNEM